MDYFEEPRELVSNVIRTNFLAAGDRQPAEGLAGSDRAGLHRAPVR